MAHRFGSSCSGRVILVAVDFSEESSAAQSWAMQIYRGGDRLVLLHVIKPPTHVPCQGGMMPVQLVEKKFKEKAMQAIENKARLKLEICAHECNLNGIPHEGCRPIEREVEWGDRKAILLKQVKELGVTDLCMGTGGGGRKLSRVFNEAFTKYISKSVPSTCEVHLVPKSMRPISKSKPPSRSQSFSLASGGSTARAALAASLSFNALRNLGSPRSASLDVSPGSSSPISEISASPQSVLESTPGSSQPGTPSSAVGVRPYGVRPSSSSEIMEEIEPVRPAPRPLVVPGGSSKEGVMSPVGTAMSESSRGEVSTPRGGGEISLEGTKGGAKSEDSELRYKQEREELLAKLARLDAEEAKRREGGDSKPRVDASH